MSRLTENALQTFLQKYPGALLGNQFDMNNKDSPRLALLGREVTLGRWSLDLLLIDQNGVLTIVETKLTKNRDARRDVVGQIIEYGAHALKYCGNGLAKQKAADYWTKQGLCLDQILYKEFGSEIDLKLLWDKAEENLKSGKIRLMIVADELRPEVREMIEFLQRNMQNAEIMGQELKDMVEYLEEEMQNSGIRNRDFEDLDLLEIVSQVADQTETGTDVKPSANSAGSSWPYQKVLDAYNQIGEEESKLKEGLLKILDWVKKQGFFMPAKGQLYPIFWLKGKKGKQVATIMRNGGIFIYLEMSRFQNQKERSSLANTLVANGLLDDIQDIDKIPSGKNLIKNISHFNENDFKALFQAIGPCCG